MTISRRDFFKGIAAVATVVAMPKGVMAAISENPRVVAWQLLNQSTVIFRQKGKCQAYFDKTAELFDHLIEHFPVNEPPSFEEMTLDCRDMLKQRGAYAGGYTQHWRTCLASTFAVMIVREGLKYRMLPMIQAPNWKKFAQTYSKIVMAA